MSRYTECPTSGTSVRVGEDSTWKIESKRKNKIFSRELSFLKKSSLKVYQVHWNLASSRPDRKE